MLSEFIRTVFIENEKLKDVIAGLHEFKADQFEKIEELEEENSLLLEEKNELVMVNRRLVQEEVINARACEECLIVKNRVSLNHF